MLKFGLGILEGESRPRSLLGDCNRPRPLRGELNPLPRVGVNLSKGVEETLLFRLVPDISARMLADLDRSKRGRLADFFSGDPVA